MSSTLQLTINAVFALRKTYPNGATPAQVLTQIQKTNPGVTLSQANASLTLGARKGLFGISGQRDDGFVYTFNRNSVYLNPANKVYGNATIIASYVPNPAVELRKCGCPGAKGSPHGDNHPCYYVSETFPTSEFPARCCE